MRRPWLLSNYTLSNYAASNITNTTATIGYSISPSASPSAWGFYMNGGTYTVSTGSLSCDVATYAGKLQPGKTYSYKTWAEIGGKRWESGTSSFTTTNNKPGSFTARISADNADIGIDDAPTVTWGKSNYTDSYTAVLYDAAGNTVQKKENISASATQFTFNPIKNAGNYTVKITAKNTAGSLVSNAVTLTVHPDVTVTFMDADPQSFVDFKEGDSTTAETLGTSTVHYGKNAYAPADPSHTGYTFKSWDSGYSSVKADKTVTATYTINTYTVTFKDVKGNALEGGVQKVPYYSAATAPAYTPSKPAYIHAGWDKDFSCVTKNMTVTAIEKWYNENYAVFAEVNSAVRDDTNKGYDVTVTLQNNENKLTTGRLVLVLKTTDGKMLTSSESAAFNLKPNASRSFNEFIPYENAAAVAYAYVVESYGSMIPIAQEASAIVDMGLDWTSWSTEKPARDLYDNDEDYQERTEYRYKTLSTTTSYDTSMPGWTRGSYKEVLDSSGTIDYVTSWPSGYNTNHWTYGAYNNTPKHDDESPTKITRVSTSIAGYLYWHWCRGSFDGWQANYNGLAWNRKISHNWTNEFWQFHTLITSSPVSVYGGNINYFDHIDGNCCGDTRWWIGRTQNENLPIYRCTWQTFNKLYTYTKLSDLTEWSDEMPSAGTFVEDTLEIRTVYRYRPKDTSVEDTDGTVRTISGTLGASFADQQVTLYVYKIGEASDYSNEYFGQTKTDADGRYSFTFKLREEPSVQTGDFTVALGVEGSNSLIYLDPIEAPRKEYTVKFIEWDGTVISEQTVYEGDNATLPDEEQYGDREGYTFSHWSDSNLNICEDKEIYAVYTINTYTVVFVDWEARNVQIRTFNHGDPLIAPDFENTDESLNVVWDKLEEGFTTVTQNMVVCTEYSKRVCTVTFSDWENNIISTQEIEYGSAAAVPELTDSDDDFTFFGWKDIETGETLDSYIITANLNAVPYVYKTSVEAPTASVESGTYTEPQTVELSCGTEGSTIFYTLDGSDPHGASAKVYTAPIVVNDYAELSFYAVCINHNDSDVFYNYYIVNPKVNRSDPLPFAELPENVVENPLEYDVHYTPGYQFKDTVIVDTASAYNSHIQDGWKPESVEPSAWSDWSDTQLFESDRIGLTFETQEVEYEETVDTIIYHRCVYTVDGETQYSKVPVDGFNYTEETVEVEEAYTITFINGDTAFMDENGTPWFNPSNSVKTVTRTRTQYRYCYNVYTLYKWDEALVFDIAEGETRERRKVDMYTYAYPKHFCVNIVPAGIQSDFGVCSSVKENGSLLVDGNGDLNIRIPEFYGYAFDKLYKDAELTQEWDLNTDRVTEDTTLYATFDPLPFKVTFAYADDTVIKSQTVSFLDAATAPESVPLPPDYLFLGWDTDAYQCVTEDMIVHARYIAADDYATISLDKSEISLLASTAVKVNAVVSAAGKDVLWSSDNEAIAFVEKDGTVRGVSPGAATITATVSDSGESAVCKVTVLPNKDANICLLTNSSLGTDSEGYIREVKEGKNTVAEIRKEFANENLVFVSAKGDVLSDTNKVGTGTVISLMSGDTVLDSVTVIMTGDVSGDGTINVRDAAMLHRAVLGKESANHIQQIAMDCNGSGDINNKDAVMILQVLVGKAII